MVGVQLIGLGMLGELGARTHYGVQNKQPYAIRRTVNFEVDVDDVERFQPRRAA